MKQRAAGDRDRGTTGRVDPRLARAFEVAALAIVLAVGLTGWAAVRRVVGARDRFVGSEVDALVETSRLRAASERAARLRREFLLTGRPALLEEAAAASAEVRDLAERATARPETQAPARALLEAQAESLARWQILAVARAGGEPEAALAARFDQEIAPVRARADAALQQLVAARDLSLAARHEELDDATGSALASLLAATAAGLLLALLLWLLLRRSVLALRASESRYRTTFESAPVGIAHVGLDGAWLRVNPRYRALLGYEEDELRRMTVPDLTHPEDRPRDAALRDRLRAGAIESYRVEKRYLAKGGGVVWVDLTMSMVRHGSGAPAYFIGAAEDVAGRRAVEDELRAAVEARDEFMQLASHELRTPLTSLRLQVESLRAVLGRPGGDLARAGVKADAALRQVLRLGDLVDGLLDVARLGDRELAIHAEPGDLAETVRAAVQRLAAEAARRGVVVHATVPAALPARFDRARVEQAVANLLSNAIKYGLGKPVDVTLEARDAAARVAVRDRGIGIGAGERERIFGRFERAVSTLHYGGFGLGLFVARRTAEAHGGGLALESAPGEGATFVLELPIAGPAAPAASAAT